MEEKARLHRGIQLSEYDDDSSDKDSEDYAVEEDSAIRDMHNAGTRFPFCIAQNAKWTDSENNKQGFALNVIFSKWNGM